MIGMRARPICSKLIQHTISIFKLTDAARNSSQHSGLHINTLLKGDENMKIFKHISSKSISRNEIHPTNGSAL